MGDYAKESHTIVNKHNDIELGDKVKWSDMYLSNYLSSATFKDKVAEVVKITKRTVFVSSMEKADKVMYAERYGIRDSYDVIGLEIRYPDIAGGFLVSEFGVVKA